VGRAFNWIMCNNGYHTIHHNRAGLHWSELARRLTRRDVKPRIDPAPRRALAWSLYLLRTYLFHLGWNRPVVHDVAAAERALASGLASREARRREAEEAARREAQGQAATA
jgi:beta-carotene hydroxylase